MAFAHAPRREVPGVDAIEDPVLYEARRVETDALYTGQANLVRATWFTTLHYLLGVPATASGVVAAAVIVAEKSPTVAGGAALLAAVLAALQTFLNTDQRVGEHTRQGNAYRSLETDARIFRTVDYESLTEAERRERLAALVKRKNDLNTRNRPGERAFKRAQRKIASGDLSYGHERDVER